MSRHEGDRPAGRLAPEYKGLTKDWLDGVAGSQPIVWPSAHLPDADC